MAKIQSTFPRLPSKSPARYNYWNVPSHPRWQFLDFNSIQFELQSKFEKMEKVFWMPIHFHFSIIAFISSTKNGRWNRGAATHAKWNGRTRNRPQGTPKSSDVTTVDRCVATTASGLCATSAQNLWNEKEPQRDSRRIEHDRSKGYNVSHDIYLRLSFSLDARWIAR